MIPILLSIAVGILMYFVYWKYTVRKLFPGPVGLPFVGFLPFLGKEPHKTFFNLRRKYGNIICLRLGRKCVVVLNEYEVFKETINHPMALNRSQMLLANMEPMGLATANGEPWREQRRFCFHALKDIGVTNKDWFKNLQDESLTLAQEIADRGDSPLDISDLLMYRLNRGIVSLLVGSSATDDKKLNLFTQFSQLSMRSTGPAEAVTLIPILRKVFEYLKIEKHTRAADVISKFSSLIKKEIFNHKTKSENEVAGDMMDIYLQEMKQKSLQGMKHYFSEDNLEGNVKSLYLGATDTSFNSLMWLYRLMAVHQDIQKMVQKELDDVFGIDGQVQYESRAKIPYTMATITEALRLSSVVALGGSRLAAEDFQIRGYTIPKDAEIISNLWGINNDPDYWKNPEVFKPERFLSEDGRKTLTNLPSFVPFSYGKRNCPGEIVAWMQITSIFTTVLQRFDISMPSGVDPRFDSFPGVILYLQPQPLCFTQRTIN